MDYLQHILSSEWFWYVLGGFAGNGFISQAVKITPTQKDDNAVSVIGNILRAVTGTGDLVKHEKK